MLFKILKLISHCKSVIKKIEKKQSLLSMEKKLVRELKHKALEMRDSIRGIRER